MQNQQSLHEDRLGFVANLEVPPSGMVHLGGPAEFVELAATDAASTTDGVTTADPSKASGFVDNGSLVSFVAGVSAQSQADVLNSTLLAQLAASRKFDREKDTENWYSFYRNVLENVGWVIQEFHFDQYQFSGSTATVNDIVAKVLAAVTTAGAMGVVTATLAAAQALSNSNDSRLTIFDQASQTAGNGNFQIGVCAESGGQVAMSMGAFYFSKPVNSDTHVLFFTFSSTSSSVYQAGQTMTLDMSVYSQVRSSIVAKLGTHALSFVANLDIGEV